MILLLSVSLSFGLLHFLKRHFSFLKFIMEEKLLRKTANLTTYLLLVLFLFILKQVRISSIQALSL